MDLIVGTAGHIDHGKTALIKALTGIDTDRLPEERLRGITIDLGFAELDLGGVHIGFVDVPGHERFVKNMLAGASGIDLVMLVVAADEGVMPQTREHFDICRLLGVDNGIIVLTKTDLADAETLEIAMLEVAELVSGTPLEYAPVVPVSARTGYGIEALRKELARISGGITSRNSASVSHLSIDRSFSVKGFGAVVTGTLASGRIDEGSDMQLLPDGYNVRVRGIQVHGRKVSTAMPGQRVAVNLGGIDHSKVARGMVLVDPDVLWPTQMFDAETEVLADSAQPLKTRQRVRVHLGTVEALARIQVLNDTGEIEPGSRGFVQVRLESPVVAIPRESFIIRKYSPQITIAGGTVLDNAAVKHPLKELPAVHKFLNELVHSNDAASMILAMVMKAKTDGLSYSNILARTGLERNAFSAAIAANVESATIRDCGGIYLASNEFDELSRIAKSVLVDCHRREPLEKGMSREGLRDRAFVHLPNEVFQAVISTLETNGTIVTEKDTVRLSAHRTELSPSEQALTDSIRSTFADAGLAVPRLDEALSDAAASAGLGLPVAKKLFARFLDSGELVKVTEEFYFAKHTIDRLTETLRKYASAGDKTIDVARFKDLAGVSRKYAIPLLEYFDQTRVTARSRDKRIIL
ncbi:MAG: selenocysteine-specific translation elongation factor [Acidobacteria bacterium]|nr:selenocysteine-specific translation elongation factor [Acidobacteriota bacterium]